MALAAPLAPVETVVLAAVVVIAVQRRAAQEPLGRVTTVALGKTFLQAQVLAVVVAQVLLVETPQLMIPAPLAQAVLVQHLQSVVRR